MGIVGDSQDESIIGETVYHFISFPADDAICIVKVNGAYQFYVKEGVEGIEKTTSPDKIIDAPVDENTYHEAEPDASTEKEVITLEYITELQVKVSTAMSNGELPFVSSSAVYENPYRLHIVVSSNAESDLSKLKAFDTIGGALEIEYDVKPISVDGFESSMQQNSLNKNGENSLAYLKTIQDNISQAMLNKELPFVSSCTVDESSLVVKVGITEMKDEYIQKLKEFENMGPALDIFQQE